MVASITREVDAVVEYARLAQTASEMDAREEVYERQFLEAIGTLEEGIRLYRRELRRVRRTIRWRRRLVDLMRAETYGSGERAGFTEGGGDG